MACRIFTVSYRIVSFVFLAVLTSRSSHASRWRYLAISIFSTSLLAFSLSFLPTYVFLHAFHLIFFVSAYFFSMFGGLQGGIVSNLFGVFLSPSAFVN